MISRRHALKRTLLGLGGLSFGGRSLAASFRYNPGSASTPYKHSVSRWCFNHIPLEAFCEKVVDMGIHSIELLGPDDWPVIKKYGLECAVGIADFVNLEDGFNDPGNHQLLQAKYRTLINQAADAGVPQIICFPGNRRGLSDAEGLEFCAAGLDPLVKQAERRGIRLIMELLNSKVDHPDYQCDSSSWGSALVEKIGSDNFKLLYDIYHMQIMEGNVIATIRRYYPYISHFHTAGVPGRHEIGDSQELHYPAIMRAIAGLGFEGYVGQEFIPTRGDGLESLRESIEICTVS